MTIMARENKESCCSRNSGLFIPAGLFLGLGMGFIYGQVVAGIFLGLGVGFVAMAISRMACR